MAKVKLTVGRIAGRIWLVHGATLRPHCACAFHAWPAPLLRHLSEWCEVPTGVVAQIMGHKPSTLAKKHYRPPMPFGWGYDAGQ